MYHLVTKITSSHKPLVSQCLFLSAKSLCSDFCPSTQQNVEIKQGQKLSEELSLSSKLPALQQTFFNGPKGIRAGVRN